MALTRALILLDTNVVLYFLGGRLIKLLPSGQYFISVIIKIELLSYPSLSSKEEVQICDFLTKITVVEIDSNIKELAIAFRKQYKLRHPDAMLFTNDVRLANLIEINTQSVQIL